MAPEETNGAATADSRQGKELIQHITDKIVNGGDFTIVRDLFSEDYVAHKPGLSLPRGPEAFKMAIRQWREAFPDYQVTIETLLGDGEFVANRFVAEGTHSSALLGVPPTGKSFRMTGTDVHRVAGGMVVESWLADDVPRIWTELGVMAPTNTQSGQWT